MPSPDARQADRYILPMDTDLMDQAMAKEEARKFALFHGGAQSALDTMDTRAGSNDFVWTLRHLAELENGSSIAWKADEKRAEWMAALSRQAVLAKAAMHLNMGVAA